MVDKFTHQRNRAKPVKEEHMAKKQKTSKNTGKQGTFLTQKEFALLLGASEANVNQLARLGLLDMVDGDPVFDDGFDPNSVTEEEKDALREYYAVHERQCSRQIFAQMCRISRQQISKLVRDGAVDCDPVTGMILLDRRETRGALAHYAEKNAALIKAKPGPFDSFLPAVD
jgi:hypothetical protein